MNIEFVARNYEISEKLKDLTFQKLSKIDKYFDDDNTRAKVSFKKQANTCTLEVMLDFCGKFVRATADSYNFYENLDVVLKKIEGQIRKHRTKFDQHNKNYAFNDESLYDIGKKEETKKSSLVKEKKFILTPMTTKEAIDEMELLGHSFYVFLDAKTQQINVLYKRADGDLGLIEPEIEK